MSQEENTRTNHEQSISPSAEVEKRRSLATSLISQHNDRIPVIVERDPDSKLPDLDKKKYLVPHNMTIGGFIVTIRRKINLETYQSLFILTKEHNYTPPSTMTMAEVYQKYHSEDKFLYFIYKSENAFG
jgi:GABA(A) receptor-associated protein